MGWTVKTGNARISFAQGGVESATQFGSLTQTFTASTAGAGAFVAATNPCAVTCSVNLSTGLCSGSFRLVDAGPVTRVVSYSGLMIPHLSTGNLIYGWFNLPQLPVGTETILTSPIQSGQVAIIPQ